MKQLKLTGTHSADDLAAFAEVEQNPRAQKRLWAIRLLLLNEQPEKVCEAFNCQLETLEAWVKRFNLHGPHGMKDLPRPGPNKRLKPDQEGAFCERVLKRPLPKDGIHTFRLLDFMMILKDEFQAEYTTESGVWRLVKRLRLSHLMPRPYNPKGDPVEQEAYKKNFLKRSKPREKNTPAKPSHSGAGMRCAPVSTAL